MIKYSFTFLLILSLNHLVFSQNTTSSALIQAKTLYKNKEYSKAVNLLELELKKTKNVALQNDMYIELYKNKYWINKITCIEPLYKAKKNYTLLDSKEKAKLDICLSNVHRILNTSNDSIIFYSLKALNYYKEREVNSTRELFILYTNLSTAYDNTDNHDKYYYYLKQNLNLLLKSKKKKNISYVYNNIGTYFSSINSFDSSLYYYKKALKTDIKNKLKGSIYQNIGAIYLGQLKKIDSAEYYFDKALKNKKTISPVSLASLYSNKAVIEQKKENNVEAIDLYNKSLGHAKNNRDLEMQSIIAENLSKLYESTGNLKKALINRKLFEQLNDSLKEITLLEKIEEYDIKYQTEKKEKKILKLNNENLEKEAESIKNRNISIVLGGSLILFSIITFLLQKNTKRKQLLAEQGKALEKQKVATLLKDQEITSINAMIEGQEKERQRIANDLHDDLGGLMATVKLQFNVLKEQQTPELFNKTNSLLDEAYNKVRSIAHAKNSGVIAKQGLLKAVKNMTHNVSSASTIDIEVTDYGLESRLENSLELTIFRIIQELTTNIIKHAEATHATISLTNHEDSLNIMIEDNGKGFNANKVVQNNGMGLHSIEKRVEHLEGELKIESQPNQGTTIIIDIPL